MKNKITIEASLFEGIKAARRNLALNERSILANQYAPAFNEGFRHAREFAVNDSLMQLSAFSEGLTTFAVGRPMNADVEGELNFLAPGVPVPRRFAYRDFSGVRGVESETNNKWPLRGDVPLIVEIGDEVDAHTELYGLGVEIDEEELDESERDTWQQTWTARLQDRCRLNSLRRAAALVIAASTNTNKTWGSSADPDQDVRAKVIALQQATAITPNKVFYGATASSLRVGSFRAQNTAGSNASALFSPQQLASFLRVQAVRDSSAVYTDGSSTVNAIIGSKVIMLRSNDSVSREDDSICKRFWTSLKGGTEFAVYLFQIGERKWRLSVGHRELVKITGNTAALAHFTVS